MALVPGATAAVIRMVASRFTDDDENLAIKAATVCGGLAALLVVASIASCSTKLPS